MNRQQLRSGDGDVRGVVLLQGRARASVPGQVVGQDGLVRQLRSLPSVFEIQRGRNFRWLVSFSFVLESVLRNWKMYLLKALLQIVCRKANSC